MIKGSLGFNKKFKHVPLVVLDIGDPFIRKIDPAIHIKSMMGGDGKIVAYNIETNKVMSIENSELVYPISRVNVCFDVKEYEKFAIDELEIIE